MKRMILAIALLTACQPHTDQTSTPEPVKMEHRRLTGVNAPWNMACIDGVEYIWALNVGITPILRERSDGSLGLKRCEVKQ